MDKIAQNSVSHLNHFYPAVAAVVTVRSGERMNAMACAWHSALSFAPPLYGVLISPKRFSYQLILDAGTFGVNFLPFEKAELIAGVGRNSGRDVDKFSAFSIATEPLPDAIAPILKDAYAAYECRLAARHPCGDHDLFVGEIVRVHQAPETFTEEGVLDVSRVRPALYLGTDWYIPLTTEPPRRLRGTLQRGK
jgi:flavin reductase (DIM6/NTAB) family NADH-FMN oxidoreductase RutF